MTARQPQAIDESEVGIIVSPRARDRFPHLLAEGKRGGLALYGCREAFGQGRRAKTCPRRASGETRVRAETKQRDASFLGAGRW